MDPADLEMKVKAADKVKVVTAEGEQINPQHQQCEVEELTLGKKEHGEQCCRHAQDEQQVKRTSNSL